MAIVGAAATIATGATIGDRAVAAVDAHALVLLFGMIRRILRLSGFFPLLVLFSGLFVE